MKERSLKVLEYDKIIAMLSAYAESESGKTLCTELRPLTSLDAVRRAQAETEEARDLIMLLGESPMQSFRDIRSSLHLAEIGATLSPKALLEVAQCLRVSRLVRGAIMEKADNVPGIAARASTLSTNKPLETAIQDAILSEEEIADRASPELFQIRRKMRSCSDRVRERLNSMVHSAGYQKVLQDNIITVRHDRYVLAVRAEYRSQVPGIIHDQSATGATLYIEPMAVVEIGNEMRQLTAAEKAEIEKILMELSAKVAPEAAMLEANLSILAALDFAFAKARFAREMGAVEPKLNGEGRLKIIRGRHPLIDRDKVVPLDIRLGSDFNTMIVTGPNTGGKTVTLKTVGLFTVMAQSGLQVPAEYGTEMAVFDAVYADIGDEQSIEQSLSTFSGHMRNIVEILNCVTPDSLTLFDELGAGTDPTEGAALAQAILATLLHQHVRTLATTHYSELKEFALTTENVENASVEFDVTTLRPTYRLSIGIPGKSNAFEISRRLGLPEYVITDAKELLSREAVRFEDVIANAEYHRQIAEKERQIAEEARQEMVRIRNQAEQERKKLEAQSEKTIQKAKEEARSIVEKTKRESEQLIRELRDMKKAGGAQEHELQRSRKRLEEAAERLEEKKDVGGEIPTNLKVGDMVHVVSMDIDATVTALADNKGQISLKAGMIKMRTELEDLRTISQKQQEIRKEKKKLENRRVNREQRISIAQREVHQEVDVRGLALNEAIPEVQKFLDDALLSSLKEVTIIHGTGTGILRTGIAEMLRKHHAVSSFRPGRYGEGEMGVTVVTLK